MLAIFYGVFCFLNTRQTHVEALILLVMMSFQFLLAFFRYCIDFKHYFFAAVWCMGWLGQSLLDSITRVWSCSGFSTVNYVLSVSFFYCYLQFFTNYSYLLAIVHNYIPPYCRWVSAGHPEQIRRIRKLYTNLISSRIKILTS
jgi:hypothetical protein